jgi:hypothetical protein
MVGQDINAFIEDLYNNPEKEITIDGAGGLSYLWARK